MNQVTDALRRTCRTVMLTAPLLPVAAGLLAGVAFDRVRPCSPFTYVSLLAVVSALLGAATVRALAGPWLLFVAAACTGGMLHFHAVRPAPPSSIERIADPQGRIVRLRGTVVSEPNILADSTNPFASWSFRTEQTAFLLAADSIEGVPSDVAVTGRVRVTVREAVLDLRENERVELFGWLFALQRPPNPGSFDWSDYYRRQGVVARFFCDHRESVNRFDPDHIASSPTTGFITWLRTTSRGLLTDDLAAAMPEEAGLLEAMVLGHRSQFDRRLNEVFIRAGCSHFIAVSGTNVAVLMSFVWFLGRIVGWTKRRCAWAMVVAVVAYALVAEPRPPILRSAVMGLLFCVSLLLRRARSHLNWISAAAAALVIVEPTTVFDAGFQLSFGAVLGVGYLGPALLTATRAGRTWFAHVVLGRTHAETDRRLMAAARPPRGVPRLRHRIDTALRSGRRLIVLTTAASVGAWLVALPIVATSFHRLQPWGPLSTIMVFPLMSAVMILGLLKIGLTTVSPTASSLVGAILNLVDSWLVRVVEVFARLPGASLSGSTPPWWVIVSFYALLVFVILRCRFRARETSEPIASVVDQNADGWVSSSRRTGGTNLAVSGFRLPRYTCRTALVFFVVSVLAWCRPTAPDDRLVVTVLAVGRGSATVIELPDGRTVLYDAGSSGGFDVGRNIVVPFLREQGVRSVDRIYVSHPDLDHFSGIPTIIEEMRTGPVVVNGFFAAGSPSKSASRHLLNLLANRGHPLETLDPSTRKWRLGDVAVELLSPLEGFDARNGENDASTVLRLAYAGRSILLTGDIEDATQHDLLARGGLRADVLVLPHHGSVRPSTREFVEAVGAEVLIRSSHERMVDTMNGLQDIVGSAPLYNTADMGAVQVTLDRNGVHVRTFGEPH